MPDMPKPTTWILSAQRTFEDVKGLAEAEAAVNGWAVKVEAVVVDGQDAALVVFSRINEALKPAAAKLDGRAAALALAATAGGPSEFEKRLAQVAAEEFGTFGSQRETDSGLSARIKEYWTGLGLHFPGVGEAWSAVFVSWCVKQAGATAAEFKFSRQHSVFVNWAIANAEARRGLFRALPVTECAPSVGDIIQNNRNGNTFSYAFASTHADYHSHSAIVVATGTDSAGRFAKTIGGNEGDKVGRTRVPLNADGLVVQRGVDPFICVIQTLK